MKIRINPLTIVMFIVLAATGNVKIYIIAYAVMTAHELAHYCAAKCIGLECESFTLSPFGAHLQLRNRIVNSFADELILYGVGPAVNAMLSIAGIVFKIPLLYNINTALFLLNILPVVPLDGGMILLRIISHYTGRKRAKTILNAFSVIMGLIFLSLAVYLMYVGSINISLFIIAVLLIGNILTAKELYDYDFINAVNAEKKNTNKTNFVIISPDYTISDAIKNISPSYTTIGVEVDYNGKIKRFITEKEMVNNIDIFM